METIVVRPATKSPSLYRCRCPLYVYANFSNVSTLIIAAGTKVHAVNGSPHGGMAVQCRARRDIQGAPRASSKPHASTQHFPWTVPSGCEPRVVGERTATGPVPNAVIGPWIAPLLGSGPGTREKHGCSVLGLRRFELRIFADHLFWI